MHALRRRRDCFCVVLNKIIGAALRSIDLIPKFPPKIFLFRCYKSAAVIFIIPVCFFPSTLVVYITAVPCTSANANPPGVRQ
jgi:hypothetical protein